MNNCPSHVDTNYYSTKYGIPNNKKDVIEHYIKKGKQSGHFPNSETEIFYCRMINFDPSYYKRKYSLHHNDNDSLMRHWKFYGHKKGYHVNRCEEVGKHAQFLCNCKIKNNSIHLMTIINDSESYMTESTQSTESESTESESTESTILSTGTDSVENFNSESVNDDYQFNGHTKKISDSESEHGSLASTASTLCGTFSETITDETITDPTSDEKTKRNQTISSLSSECPSVPNSEDFITSGSGSGSESGFGSGSGSGSSISKECDCSECQMLIGQKIKNENTFFDAKKTKTNIQRIQINKPSNMENKIMELKIIGLDDRRKKNPIQHNQSQLLYQQNQTQSQSQPSYQQSQQIDLKQKQNQNYSEEKEWKKETSINVSVGTYICTNNKSQTNTSTDDPDNDSFGEYMDDSYQKVSSMCNGIKLDQSKDHDKGTTLAKDPLVKETMIEDTMIKETMIKETMIEETMIKETIHENQCNYVKSYYPTLEIGLNTLDTETSFREKIARDEARLCKIQDNIKNYAMINPEPYNIVSEKAIFDNHMENVCQNITNIKNYLHMCQIHLDTYIIIFKQAYQCITNICNAGNNYMGYNAARIRLSNMLKEAENISNSSYYNDLPIFFTNRSIKSNGSTKGYGSTKSPSFIKFPLLISMSDNVNDILAKTIGDDHVYFKVRLMRVSVRCLKLEKYCFPALNRGDKITAHTSPIPPCDCPVGKIPDRNMYTDQDLIKCWDIGYHLKVFENAMYKITMTNEILNNYHKLIEIKEELCYKIKLANLKN